MEQDNFLHSLSSLPQRVSVHSESDATRGQRGRRRAERDKSRCSTHQHLLTVSADARLLHSASTSHTSGVASISHVYNIVVPEEDTHTRARTHKSLKRDAAGLFPNLSRCWSGRPGSKSAGRGLSWVREENNIADCFADTRVARAVFGPEKRSLA